MLRDQTIPRPDPNKPIERDKVVIAFEVCRDIIELFDESTRLIDRPQERWPLLYDIYEKAKLALGNGGVD
jgi:hypothetical protein